MHEPHKLPNVLTGVMLSILGVSSFHSRLLFLTRGSAPRRRATFGSEIHTVVPVNFDTESKMVQLVSLFSSLLSVKPLTCGMQVQFIYSLVIMLSVLLRLLPATIPWKTQSDVCVKWTKNVFRCGALISCLALCMVLKCTSDSGSGRSGVWRCSAGWGADLDELVAFIGCFVWYLPPLTAASPTRCPIRHNTSLTPPTASRSAMCTP
jgi:hypothetical protein